MPPPMWSEAGLVIRRSNPRHPERKRRGQAYMDVLFTSFIAVAQGHTWQNFAAPIRSQRPGRPLGRYGAWGSGRGYCTLHNSKLVHEWEREGTSMKSCRHCNSVEPDNTYTCSVCQRALPFKGPSRRAVQKTAITVAVPIFVWVVMTRMLGV